MAEDKSKNWKITSFCMSRKIDMILSQPMSKDDPLSVFGSWLEVGFLGKSLHTVQE